MQGAVSKAEFARIVRVTRGRVSQWIAAGQIDGEALVIEGRSERIVVEAARRQLGDRLGVDQRAPMSKARLDGVASSPIEADIKIARLRQLTLGNEKLIAEAAERAGRYVLADDARREMGKITGRMARPSTARFPSWPPPSPRSRLCRNATPCMCCGRHGAGYASGWPARRSRPPRPRPSISWSRPPSDNA